MPAAAPGPYSCRDCTQYLNAIQEEFYVTLSKFKNLFRFLRDESAAVTVDWVVLTAAIVGLGVAVITTIKDGSEATANDVRDAITAIAVGTD
jgi:Flp pilus assembly pilin Flp